MRITKPSTNEDPKLLQKQMALEECEVCPSCSSKDSIIPTETCDYTETHLFWSKQWTRMEFKCCDCGCEFESDPYDFEAKPGINPDYLFCDSALIIVGCVVLIISGILMFSSSGATTFSDTLGAIFFIIGSLGIVFWTAYAILASNIYKKYNFYKEFEPKEVHRDIQMVVRDKTSEHDFYYDE